MESFIVGEDHVKYGEMDSNDKKCVCVALDVPRLVC